MDILNAQQSIEYLFVGVDRALGREAFSCLRDGLVAFQRSLANCEQMNMSKPRALEGITFTRQFGIFIHQQTQIGCPKATVDVRLEPFVLQILDSG